MKLLIFLFTHGENEGRNSLFLALPPHCLSIYHYRKNGAHKI